MRATNKEQESSLEQLQTKLRELSVQLANVTAERDAARVLVEQSRAYLEQAQERMRTVFVEAASTVFDEKSAALDRKILATSELSKQQLEQTLKPFAENVTKFQNKIEQLSVDQTRDQANLTGQIGKLQELNASMAEATNSLARALKGNAKTRGDWGEMILETVLKASGLEEGKTFRRQAHLRDEDTDQRRHPDVIVDLPDGRQVVIDSKVNLVAWAEANEGEITPEQYNDALIRHAAGLRGHMRDLAEKNYPKAVGSQALEMTVLFVPIEGALAAALAIDPSLQADAFSKRVCFASPNTLMALLKVVERLWMRDQIQRQVERISDEAGKLLDSLTGFLVEFNKIDGSINTVRNVFNSAKSKLSESNKSVVAYAGRLVQAGARGKKDLHPDLLEAAEVASTPLLPSISTVLDGAEDPASAASPSATISHEGEASPEVA